MKIALIHYRLIHRGGLENRLKNYIAHWRKEGHDITVICAKYEADLPFLNEINLIHLSPGITLKPFRKLKFSKLVKKHLLSNTYDLSISLGRTEGQQMVLAPSNHLGYMQAHGKKRKSFSR